MEIPTNEPSKVNRRVVSIETLEGTESRDFGSYESDIAFSINTELSDGDLAALTAALESGAPLGLSTGGKSFAVLVSEMDSRRIGNDRHEVKIEFKVTRKI